MAGILDDLLQAYSQVVTAVNSLVAFQHKITPDTTLADQFEELSEVLEYQQERIRAHHLALSGHRRALIPLVSLLRVIQASTQWLEDNDTNLKGFWSAQEIHDAVEVNRERCLDVFASRISLAILASQEDNTELQHILAGIFENEADDHDIQDLEHDTIEQASAVVSFDALKEAKRMLEKEYGELEDNIPDFPHCQGGIFLKAFIKTLSGKIGHKESIDSSRPTSSQISQQGHGHSGNSSARPLSMATVESTCDPYQSSILSALAQARQVSLPSSSEEGVRSPTTTVLTSFHSPRTFHSEIVDAPYPTMQTDGTGTSQFQGGSDTWFSRDSAVTGLSHLEEDRVSESYYNDSDPGAVVGPPVDNANGSTSDAARGARTGLTSSIIAFNTKDALTNEPLVDPVLGSDGLIHDRWSLLDTDNALARSITILGDVIQLRDAIHAAQADLRKECYRKRSAYRNRVVDACTSTDFKVIEECIVRMTNILQWKNDDIEMLTRRGLLYYRMRQLAEAKADLDLAVQKSKESSVVSLPNLDSLRYRCLVLCEIRDVESALLDMQEVEKQTKDDPLVLSLRATILAGKGEIDEAERDLETVRRTLEMGGGSQSTLADENRDLDLLAKGWAHSSMGQIVDAMNDFEMSQSLRTFDPYIVSCLGISLVHYGLQLISTGQEYEGREKTRQGLGELSTAILVVSRNSAGEELTLPSPNGTVDEAMRGMTLGSEAYDPFFLRGMAHFALEQYVEALEDFDVAQRVRPKIVKDTGEFYCVLGIVQAETGRYTEAMRSFDYAMALKPQERDNYLAKRAQYNL